jgi:hypothetical protein
MLFFCLREARLFWVDCFSMWDILRAKAIRKGYYNGHRVAYCCFRQSAGSVVVDYVELQLLKIRLRRTLARLSIGC